MWIFLHGLVFLAAMTVAFLLGSAVECGLWLTMPLSLLGYLVFAGAIEMVRMDVDEPKKEGCSRDLLGLLVGIVIGMGMRDDELRS